VAWYWWIVVALVMTVVEIVTVDLVFIMLVAGAVAAALAALVTDSLVAQALVGAIVSGGALAFVRPVALRHLTLPHAIRTGTAKLIGEPGLVLERVDARDGRVKIGGEVWSARAYDPADVFEPGTPVEVARIDGATAVVYSTEP
jgi:membrane protein implicated in regulation of membrane protease activity